MDEKLIKQREDIKKALGITDKELDELLVDLSDTIFLNRLLIASIGVSSLMDPQSAMKWLKEPNADFYNLPPINLLYFEASTKYLFEYLDRGMAGSPLK